MGIAFSFTQNEIKRSLTSLDFMLDLKRGEFYNALSYYQCLSHMGEEWEMAKGVICQLIAQHTVDNVDGVTKVLEGSAQWHVGEAVKLRQRLNDAEFSFPGSRSDIVNIYLEDNELFLLKGSLYALSEVHNNNIYEVLAHAPFNHEELYTEEGLNDWHLTRMQVMRILQQYTLPRSYDYAKLTFDLASRFKGVWRFA